MRAEIRLSREINPEHLPPRARELAGIVGLPALLALVEWRGGVYVYVPHEPKPEQELARRIGLDAARALAAEYPGESIEVPKCDQAARAALHAQIAARRQAGESESSVALDVGFTGRWVREITARHRDDDGQGDLFG